MVNDPKGERQMEQLKVGKATLTRLKGDVNFIDRWGMLGVVPKPLLTRRYPVKDKNQIELRTDPILIQLEGKNYLVDAGMGNGKLSEKQMRNFGVLEESFIEISF